jgi:hypothetical protein
MALRHLSTLAFDRVDEHIPYTYLFALLQARLPLRHYTYNTEHFRIYPRTQALHYLRGFYFSLCGNNELHSYIAFDSAAALLQGDCKIIAHEFHHRLFASGESGHFLGRRINDISRLGFKYGLLEAVGRNFARLLPVGKTRPAGQENDW